MYRSSLNMGHARSKTRSRGQLVRFKPKVCPDHNYVIYRYSLKSFGTFVHHHWTVCGTKELRQYLQGQGHTLSSKVKCLSGSELCRSLWDFKFNWHICSPSFKRCVARKNYVDISKVKVTLWVQRSKMAINELVRAITMAFDLWDFKIIWQICPLLLDGVSSERSMSISPRSRSHFEFKGKKMALKKLVRETTMSFIVRF